MNQHEANKIYKKTDMWVRKQMIKSWFKRLLRKVGYGR